MTTKRVEGRPEVREPRKYKWWGSGLGYGKRYLESEEQNPSKHLGPEEMEKILETLERLTGFRPPGTR